MLSFPATLRRWSLRRGLSTIGPLRARDETPSGACKDKVQPPGWYWLQHSMVRERVSTLISGRPYIDVYQRLAEVLEDLGHSPPLAACVSLGCGTGGLERDLVRRGLVGRIEAYDRSESAIEEARRLAAEQRMDCIRYHLADLNAEALPERNCDAVFAHSFVHRVEALEHLFDQVHRALKPNGILHLDEFVGPSLFQWTEAQMSLINGWLDSLPDRLAQLPGAGGRKPPVQCPAEEAMLATASPQAIRSAELRDVLSRQFDIIEDRPYGGTLLHMGLGDIAQNFDVRQPEDVAALQRLFDLEDEMIASGVIGSDFAVLTAVPVTRSSTARPDAVAARARTARLGPHRRLRPPAGFDVPGLDLTVSRADTMLVSNDGHYLSVGQSAIAAIDRALEGEEPSSILDLPCGFGRVTRALRARFPAASITVSDLDRPGVDFAAALLAARPAYSLRDFRELDLGERFDLVWVGSLITHLPAEQTKHLLAALGRHLTPSGTMLVTVHGTSIVPRLRETGYGLPSGAAEQVIEEFGRTGFGYRDYVGGKDLYGVSLSNENYGISLTGEPWMRAALADCGLELHRYEERSWDNHHDVVVARRPAIG